MFSHFLFYSGLGTLVVTYVDAINSGSVPCLENAVTTLAHLKNSATKGCLGRISCDLPQTPEGRKEGRLLYLAGKEISVGLNKTWPMCSSQQVTCSPVRTAEYTSLFSFL